MPKAIKEYKALDKKREYRNKQRKSNYRIGAEGSIPYRRWTDSEIALVLKHEISDRELAICLQRSVQSIQICRCRHKISG